jgi:hypothetical protein
MAHALYYSSKKLKKDDGNSLRRMIPKIIILSDLMDVNFLAA